MRSRFCAFAVADAGYLLATWHPSSRPARLELDPAVVWTRLEVVLARGGPFDQAGVVEFRAHYRVAGQEGSKSGAVLHELSRFVREDGRWFYVDGVIDPGPTPRN